MTEHNQNTTENTLADDVDDLEESLYEFHLRLRDMTARHLWHGASQSQRMAGLLLEAMGDDLAALYRRAATIQKHLR